MLLIFSLFSTVFIVGQNNLQWGFSWGQHKGSGAWWETAKD